MKSFLPIKKLLKFLTCKKKPKVSVFFSVLGKKVNKTNKKKSYNPINKIRTNEKVKRISCLSRYSTRFS